MSARIKIFDASRDEAKKSLEWSGPTNFLAIWALAKPRNAIDPIVLTVAATRKEIAKNI